MSDLQIQAFLEEVKKLHERHELAETVGPDWYEPGMMEYLDKSEGIYDADSGIITMRFEAAGTRYEGRTELIEDIHEGDEITVMRDEKNPYNSNNFVLLTSDSRNAGNMPAVLCNVAAPLYDEGKITIQKAYVSYAEPLSVRSRYAKKAVLFVEMTMKLERD